MKMCIRQGDAGRSLPLAMIQSLVAYLRQTRLLNCCTMAQIRKSTLSMMKTPVTMTATMPTSQSATRAMLATKKGATTTMYAQLPVNHPAVSTAVRSCIWLIIMETERLMRTELVLTMEPAWERLRRFEMSREPETEPEPKTPLLFFALAKLVPVESLNWLLSFLQSSYERTVVGKRL